MRSWLRRLRGLVGTAVIWGAAWFGLSAIAWTIALFGDVPVRWIVNLATGVGVAGAIAGAGFSVLLGIAERKRTLAELSFLRLAGWGAVGGILVGLPFIGDIGGAGYLPVFGMLAVLGAGSASGSLALARMADDPSRLDEGQDLPTLPAGPE